MKSGRILLALCEGNPPVTGGFPSQRDSNVESIMMQWDSIVYLVLVHDSDQNINLWCVWINQLDCVVCNQSRHSTKLVIDRAKSNNFLWWPSRNLGLLWPMFPMITTHHSGIVSMHTNIMVIEYAVSLLLTHWGWVTHYAFVTRPPLVHIMAYCLFGAKPLPEPMLAYCRLDPWEQSSVKF